MSAARDGSRGADRVLDVSALPTLVSGARAPLWWGVLFLVVIEATVFATFVSSYFYLRFLAPEWPPPDAGPPDLGLPTINTFVLIGSSLAVLWADRGLRVHGDVRRLKLGLGLATLLGLVFLGLKIWEYSDVKYYWDTHAYGSVVWTIIVFHSAHVASVILKSVAVLTLAFQGHWTRQRHLGVQVNGLYWHFVVGIWIPLYITLYWVPRL